VGVTLDTKTAVSLPDPLFQSAERLAARMGVSRSELYRRALEELLARHDESRVTAQLNEVYADPADNAGLDPGLARLQSRSVAGGRRRRRSAVFRDADPGSCRAHSGIVAHRFEDIPPGQTE
jgi:Arc/MetJ-type ribon-helix-helix transcriptional regulator